jgi:hypothetical protein
LNDFYFLDVVENYSNRKGKTRHPEGQIQDGYFFLRELVMRKHGLSFLSSRRFKLGLLTALVVSAFFVLHPSFSTGTLVGDINHDGVVDLSDAVLLALAYGSHAPGLGTSWSVSNSFAVSGNWIIGAVPASSNWNANADLNHDEIVYLDDAVLLALNYGDHS